MNQQFPILAQWPNTLAVGDRFVMLYLVHIIHTHLFFQCGELYGCMGLGKKVEEKALLGHMVSRHVVYLLGTLFLGAGEG